LSLLVLIAGAIALLLMVALALVAIVKSDRDERKTVISVIVIGGFLLFCCLSAVAGLVWYLVNYSA
jgi:hypothetical protein